jgi:signal transduction histidine kinase
MIGSSMRKVALVFVLAVIAPSLVLAWLAVRSLRDQELVLERQRALLYQGVADSLAQQVQQQIAEQQREFAQRVESFFGKQEPAVIAPQFDDYLRKTWHLADVGFVVSLGGALTCPPLPGRAEGQAFRLENEAFLAGNLTCSVSWSSPKGVISPGSLSGTNDVATAAVIAAKTGVYATKKGGDETVTPIEAKFIQIVGDAHEGTLARFLQDQLKLLFWYRSPRDASLVFGAQLKLPELTSALKPLVTVDAALAKNICVVLFDDNGKPTAMTAPNFSISKQRPFVATEIGEVLPHWKIAVYQLNPAQLNQAARTARLTLGLLIALLVLAIAVGSWVIVHCLRQEITLARQKTDFVSNVSHELKTPLTSIRMFAEMLAEDRVAEPDKRRQFHQIIASEASRLTRLINNVLDFARLERGEKKYQFAELDLAALVAETVAAYRPHLEAAGFTLTCELSAGSVPLCGDRDALAQVLVNLLSNAEKYSSERKEICVQMKTANGAVEVRVQDRGMGVPRGCEEKIFEQFYRAHDSLSSGIQGSGLGLTLARQIAAAHGGEVMFESREGGGSCFTLLLPGDAAK